MATKTTKKIVLSFDEWQRLNTNKSGIFDLKNGYKCFWFGRVYSASIDHDKKQVILFEC